MEWDVPETQEGLLKEGVVNNSKIVEMSRKINTEKTQPNLAISEYSQNLLIPRVRDV